MSGMYNEAHQANVYLQATAFQICVKTICMKRCSYGMAGADASRLATIHHFQMLRNDLGHLASNQRPWLESDIVIKGHHYPSRTAICLGRIASLDPLTRQVLHHLSSPCINSTQFKRLSAVESGPQAWSITYCTGQEAFDAAPQGPINIERGQVLSAPSHYSLTATQLLPRELLHLLQPYLVRLYERVVAIQHTIQVGKLVEAWFEMGRLTREAEAHNRTYITHRTCIEVTTH